MSSKWVGKPYESRVCSAVIQKHEWDDYRDNNRKQPPCPPACTGRNQSPKIVPIGESLSGFHCHFLQSVGNAQLLRISREKRYRRCQCIVQGGISFFEFQCNRDWFCLHGQWPGDASNPDYPSECEDRDKCQGTHQRRKYECRIQDARQDNAGGNGSNKQERTRYHGHDFARSAEIRESLGQRLGRTRRSKNEGHTCFPVMARRWIARERCQVPNYTIITVVLAYAKDSAASNK